MAKQWKRQKQPHHLGTPDNHYVRGFVGLLSHTQPAWQARGRQSTCPWDMGCACKHCRDGKIKDTSLIAITKTRRNHHSFTLPFRVHAVHFSNSLPPQSRQVIPDPSDSPVHHCSHSKRVKKRNSTLREGNCHQEFVSELPFSCMYSD